MPHESIEDVLYGVPKIAAETGFSVRQVYHLKSHHGLPTFKIGRTVCASRKAVGAWLRSREAEAKRNG